MWEWPHLFVLRHGAYPDSVTKFQILFVHIYIMCSVIFHNVLYHWVGSPPLAHCTVTVHSSSYCNCTVYMYVSEVLYIQYKCCCSTTDNFACIVHIHCRSTTYISAMQIGDLMRSFKLLLYKAEKAAFEEVYTIHVCVWNSATCINHNWFIVEVHVHVHVCMYTSVTFALAFLLPIIYMLYMY